MSGELLIVLTFLIVTSIMGFPIGFSLFGSGILYFIVMGQDPTFAAELVLHGFLSTFILLAIPLFIFAARIMNEGAITERLLNFSLALVGRTPGGLAHVNVLTSLIFAGMSGAATADVAGVGNVLIRMMTEKNRYTPGFAAAITAASATIGPVFPPSLMMIFYALVSSTSIGALFLGGIVPGVFMAALMMLTIVLVARRRNFPVEDRVPASAFFTVFAAAILPLLMPVILLGGIYSGAFTPTEASGIAGLYALGLSGIVYRSLGPAKLYRILSDTARTTGIVATVILGAFVFSYILTSEQIPNMIAARMQGLDLTPFQFLLLVNAVLLILGAFLETTTIILVIVPLLLPSVHGLGIDPVHFGVLVTLNVTIGLVTPPYGFLLFVISGLNKIPIKEILKEIWLFIAVLIFALLVIAAFPGMTTFMPTLLGF